MRTSIVNARSRNTWRELVLLLLASLACVVVLTTAIVDRTEQARGADFLEQILLIAIVGGIAGFAVLLVWHTTRSARARMRLAETENRQLRRTLAATEAIIKAEPQVLVFWEQGQGVKVVTQTLRGVPGLPDEQAELLRFGRWLDAKSASDLKLCLDALFADGYSFDLILRTTEGGHVEAEGRAAGGRAVMRLRDIAGYKRDVTAILEHQQVLDHDIRSSRALLEALPVPVWQKRGGAIEWANSAYARAVEAASTGEVLERQIELLDSRQRQSAEAALAGGRAFQKKLSLSIAGDRKMHEVVMLPVDDTIVGAAVGADVLEAAVERPEQHQAAFDRALDRVATAVAIFNREQALVYFNAAYMNLWQLDAVWLAARPSHTAVLDRLRELGRLPEALNYRDWKTKVLARDPAFIGESVPWHLPDGRTLRVLAEPRSDGGVTYLYVDDTEKLALESRYKTLINVQGETLNSLKEAVAVFGTDGRLKLFNSAFAGIWKLPLRVLEEGPHIDQVITVARQLYDDPPMWSGISAAVTSISVERQPFDSQILRPDGSVIDFATMPLPDGGTLLTFADVTVSKRYERALEERNEALVAADELKNRFIGHVSYELRSPLTNIIGFSELLTDSQIGYLNDKQRDYLDHIGSSSRTLLAIINDILDLATIDAGSLELKPTPVDVREVIDAAIEGVREAAARARLTLDIAIADDATTFLADASRVRQILYNLMSNAVGFSNPAGTVHLAAWREKDEMVFRIEDEGVGIPLEQQGRVFERFESRSHGSQHRGAGLGLAIVKSLVELHGGSIALDSEPGRGTRVTVRLPAVAAGQSSSEPLDHDRLGPHQSEA